RLKHCDPVVRVDGYDPVHPLQLDDDAALDGQRTSAQTRACAAWQKWNPEFIRHSDNLRYLLGCSRKYNNLRLVLKESQSVAFVSQKFGVILEDCKTAEDIPKPFYDFFLHCFFCCSLRTRICSLMSSICG